MVLVLAWGVMAQGEVTPEELIRGVDKMSPEQVRDLQQKLESKLWQPVPPGFFSRMAVDFGLSSSSLDTVDLRSISRSGGGLVIDQVSGADFGLLWRLHNDQLRLGFRGSSWGATDSNLGEAGYSRVDLTGGSIALVVNYQWVRSSSWLFWTELAPGSGNVEVEAVDTPAKEPTTLRWFDSSFSQVDIQAGASWRFNPVLTLFLSGGYRFAENVDLKEGGRKSAVKLDASGVSGRIGLGVNF